MILLYAADHSFFLILLNGEDGRTRGHAADNGNLDGVARCGIGGGTVGVHNLDAAAEARGAVDVALLDEGGEDRAHAVCRGNLEMVADFADGGRHVVFAGILLDVFVDFFLTGGQFLAFAVIHDKPRIMNLYS